MRDRRDQIGSDALDFIFDLSVVEVEVLGTHQEHIIGSPLIHTLEQSCGELHQTAGLAEAFIFLEQGDQVLERGVEGVSLSHLLGDLFDTGRDDIAAILGLFDLLCVFFRNFRNGAFIGELVDQALLEDFVDFISGQLHRSNGHGLAASFLLEIVYSFGQCLGLCLVATGKVGDDDTAVRQLQCCAHQCTQAVDRHVCKSAVAEHLG